MWFCVTTITGEVDSFQSDPLKPKGKHFYISCFVSLSLSLSRRFCVRCCPDDPGAELFFWQVSDEQVRIKTLSFPSSILAAAALKRRTHAKKMPLWCKRADLHTNQWAWSFPGNASGVGISKITAKMLEQEKTLRTSCYCLNITREVTVNGVSFSWCDSQIISWHCQYNWLCTLIVSLGCQIKIITMQIVQWN